MDDGLVAELVDRRQLTNRMLEFALEGEFQAFDITFDGRLTTGRR